MSHLDHREPALFMVRQSPCLCLIETYYQLHLILNNPQTSDLGNWPANDGFYPHLPFIGGTPEKSLTPSGQFWLRVHKDCQPAGQIRYPSLVGLFFTYNISRWGDGNNNYRWWETY
jgi:hypothetical protein